jgi:hypothetical protein
MSQIFTILMFSSIFFWQTTCREKPQNSIQDSVIVETQIKKSDGKTTIEFSFSTPIYWGEKGNLIERGASPIEPKKAVFNGKELTAFKVGEMMKYKFESSEEISLEKTYQMLVTTDRDKEFQGEIKLNQKQYLSSAMEKK